jgi:L-asparaginase II
VVEAIHRVHGVAVQDGAVIAEAGDSGLVAFMRSSSKPLQALPVARARDDLDARDLAIASASHLADPAQLAAVRALLSKAPANEDELECGPEGEPPSRLKHNCSGKHAGMLAACRGNDWPLHPYRSPDHPLQRRIAELIGDGETATDGCGVPTFATTLVGAAALLTRTPPRIRAAMQARPELIGGSHDAVDTDLMRLRPGWIAKGGAEGLLCAAHDDGRGIALKAEDGAYRAIGPALAHVLGIDELAESPLRNSRNEVVGAITLAS